MKTNCSKSRRLYSGSPPLFLVVQIWQAISRQLPTHRVDFYVNFYSLDIVITLGRSTKMDDVVHYHTQHPEAYLL